MTRKEEGEGYLVLGIGRGEREEKKTEQCGEEEKKRRSGIALLFEEGREGGEKRVGNRF